MKLVKSLLLGTAGGLMAVAGAQAADLPSRKAAPAAEYVRVCSAYGSGYFFIPGTDTCLRVSGQVRAEALVSSTYGRFSDAYGIRARARMNLDARTQTGWGTLRTFIRAELNNQNGQYLNRGGFTGVGTRIGGTNVASTAGTLMFIQFAGITAGRYTSFFDFYGTDAYWNFGPISGSQGDSVNGFAYTATFGGGFSATIALESRQDRENAFTAIPYAGARYPDLVGVLRLQQGWGTAQLMGAVRDVNIASTGLPVPAFASSKTGYAIGAGVMFNLPMLAPGSQLYLEGIYTQGMVSHLGIGGTNRLGYATASVTDYAVGVIGPNTVARLAEGYSLMAALRHFWTPTIKQAIFAGYSNVSYGTLSPIAGAFAQGRSFSRFEVGTNVIWSPVAGLDIGVEVLYRQIDPRGSFTYVDRAGVARVKGSESGWEGRLRIQRDF